MPEQFKKQEGIAEQGETQEQVKIPEQEMERNQRESGEHVKKSIENAPQELEQTAISKSELPPKDKVKLEKIKNLSPKEQVKQLIEFALDKEEKGGPQRAIEIAAGLDNPNVLDGVRDGLAEKMEELVAEKKIKEI